MTWLGIELVEFVDAIGEREVSSELLGCCSREPPLKKRLKSLLKFLGKSYMVMVLKLFELYCKA